MRIRRTVALLAAGALLAAASACAEDVVPVADVDDDVEAPELDDPEGAEYDVIQSPPAQEAVEVFTWWTAGGEAEGLDALVEVFADRYPEYEFVNAAVAGGAGTAARAVLASRLAAGDPPSSWQGHAGQELIGTYVAAGQLESLNFLFEEESWLDVLPDAVIPQISEDGNIYSVPVNIHRANILWYVPEQLEDLGVDVPGTWDEFFAVAEELDAQG